MTIYIDLYFFNNFIIDLFLLTVSGMCFKRILDFKRLFLSSVLGGLYSTLALFSIPFISGFLFKTMVSCLMIFIAYKLTLKEFLKQLMGFYLCSFSLAGIIITLSSYQKEDVMFFGNSLYFKIPFLNIILSGIIMSVFTFKIFKNMVKRHKLNSVYKTVKIRNGKTNIKITGFIDTGNNLKYFGVPVCIISPGCAKKLNPEICFEVPCFTVSGVNFLKAFSADEVYISNEKADVLIAISNAVSGEDYDMLINSEFLLKEGCDSENDIPMAF